MIDTWKSLNGCSTADLVELIQKKTEAEGKTKAELAFQCLCFRFQEEIICNIRVVTRKWGYDLEVADEIAYNAFDRFWKYPKFDSTKCKTDNIDKCFIFYIHKICRRLLINHKNNVHLVSSGEVGEIVFEFPKLPDSINDQKKNTLVEMSRKIEAALNKLGPKHKAIYLTYKAYERTGKKLPRPLLDKLRVELQLTQNTIRFYKKEAIEITQKILNEYGTSKRT